MGRRQPKWQDSKHEIGGRRTVHIPAKAQIGLMLGKNIQVVIAGFQVKFGKIGARIEKREGRAPIFEFGSLLINMAVHVSQIQNQALFATWFVATESGLHTISSCA